VDESLAAAGVPDAAGAGAADLLLGMGRTPRARAAPLAAVSASAARRSCSSGPSSAIGDDSARHLEPRTVQAVRHVCTHSGGHQNLLRPRDQRREPIPAPGVQFGKHVIEQQ
jgi:hypothetical protein